MKKRNEIKQRNPYMEEMTHLKSGPMKPQQEKRINNKNKQQEYMEDFLNDKKILPA